MFAFFNLLHAPQEISFDFENGPVTLYDLWSKEEISPDSPLLTLHLGPRESRIFRILHK